MLLVRYRFMSGVPKYRPGIARIKAVVATVAAAFAVSGTATSASAGMKEALAPRPDGTYKVMYARVDAVSATEVVFTPLSGVSSTGSGVHAANTVYGNPDPSTGRRYGYKYAIDSPATGDLMKVSNPAVLRASIDRSSPRVSPGMVGRVVAISAVSTTDSRVRTTKTCKITAVYNGSSSKVNKTISGCKTDSVGYNAAVLTLTSISLYADSACGETAAVKVPLPRRGDTSFKVPYCFAGTNLFAMGPEYPEFEQVTPDMYPVVRPTKYVPWFETQAVAVSFGRGPAVSVPLYRGRWSASTVPVPAKFSNAAVTVTLDVEDDGKPVLTSRAGVLSR